MMCFLKYLVLCVLFTKLECVDRTKFRTCADTRFCKSHRQPNIFPIESQSNSNNNNKIQESFQLLLDSITYNTHQLSGKIITSNSNEFNLVVSAQLTGSVRIKITENGTPRWQPTDLLLPHGLIEGQLSKLSINDPLYPKSIYRKDSSENIALRISSSGALNSGKEDSPQILIIYTNPLKFELYKDNILLLTLNERQLLHFETSHSKDNNNNNNNVNRNLQEQEQDQRKQEILRKEKEMYENRHQGKEIVSYGEDGLAIYADGTHEQHQQFSVENDDENQSRGLGSVEGKEGGDNFGGHADSEPQGHMSVGLDISFPFARHVYGIPEHSTPFSLPTTIAGNTNKRPYYVEPYRLYNLDVFEYELDNTMTLYGQIPFMLAHGLVNKQPVTAGIFWFNPSETFIDISDTTVDSDQTPNSSHDYKQSHWMSETGDLDVFLFAGQTHASVYRQYAALVGTQQLPPLFALGYHQCRWNYRDQRDVAAVEGMFEQLDYPMDVIWLDIEHTDGKRYFTWDKSTFPTPLEMQKNVSAHGRRMVSIVDPHIKRDPQFPVHKEATDKGYYIKTKDGQDFDGWCWPGSSSYLDFTDPTVRQWWSEQFALDKYIGSTMDLFTWNDMNEPSVFNGPEVSMPKDCKNLKGVEHRYWHNLYGLYMQSATADGLTSRSVITSATPPATATNSLFSLTRTAAVHTPAPLAQQQRPFVLSRAFWAGSQRFGAIWTGDNTASWGHFKIAAPMLLSLNIAGLSFAGADLGGFFGDPSAELFTRWYQAAAFTPFFRNHAHLDSKRREPWLYGEPYTTIVRSVTMARYSLLPYWYTIFFHGFSTGMPVMRPMLMEFPYDEDTFTMDNQWMIGDAVLVCPVTDEGATSVSVYFPTAEIISAHSDTSTTSSSGSSSSSSMATTPVIWYDFHSLVPVGTSQSQSAALGQRLTINAPIDFIPVYIRSGKIIPRKMRLRRSSKLMFHDPYTLIITPSTTATATATGSVYIDDEITRAHEITKSYLVRDLKFEKNKITSTQGLSSSSLPSSSTLSSEEIAPIPIVVEYKPLNTIERIEIAGQTKAFSSAVLTIAATGETRTLAVFYDSTRQVVTVKKPDCLMAEDWTIDLIY